MGLRLIRQKSDTPNVQNKDDVRMVRYAYGGYDGVVKNKGTECSYTTSGTTFKINSGVLVLQGWETEIDGNGWEMSIDSLTKYYAVYLEVNLATDTAAIKSAYATGAVPSIESGDDLTTTINGTARMTLYTFKTTGGVISSVTKLIKSIEYLTSVEKSLNNSVSELRDFVNRKKSYEGSDYKSFVETVNSLKGKFLFLSVTRKSGFGPNYISFVGKYGSNGIGMGSAAFIQKVIFEENKITEYRASSYSGSFIQTSSELSSSSPYVVDWQIAVFGE